MHLLQRALCPRRLRRGAPVRTQVEYVDREHVSEELHEFDRILPNL